MTRPFSVVIAAFEVAFGISFLLSLGFWGEHRSILRRFGRNRGSANSLFAGIFMKSSERRPAEFPQTADRRRGRSSPAPRGRARRSARRSARRRRRAPRARPGRRSRPSRRGSTSRLWDARIERAEELLAIEGLAMAVALDDLEALRDGPLVGGEAMAARRALTPAPDRVTLGVRRVSRVLVEASQRGQFTRGV